MKKFVGALFAFAFIALCVLLVFKHPAQPVQNEQPPKMASSRTIQSNTPANFQTSSPPHLAFSKLKSDLKDFTDFEKAEFATNFVTRYKPALEKWCGAFSNRVPISADAVTTDNFVERIGTRPAYREYIFVVDGITLGIQDKNGVARVDYLNVPQQTRELARLPDGSEAPISIAPVSKDEVVKILFAEGGTQFKPNDVRLIPSGYSGALNGGAFVNVGGNPNNAASWKYDMVFGANGKLAYYLRGR